MDGDTQVNQFTFEKMVEFSTDLYIKYTREGKIIYCNDSISITGYSKQDIIGKNVFELLLPEDLEKIKEKFSDVQNNISKIYLDKWIHKQNGSIVYFESYGTIIGDEIVFISKNITKFQEKSLNSWKIINSFFNSTHLIMGIVKLIHKIIDCDQTVCCDPTHFNDIMYIKLNESSMNFLNTNEDSDSIQNKTASETGLTTYYIEFWIEHYLQVKQKKIPINFDYNQSNISYWSTVSSIDESLNIFSYILEESKFTTELGQDRQNDIQERMRLIAFVSHEIRNYVNGIYGLTELIGYSSEISEENTENLKLIENCTDNLLRLIDDTLEWTRIAQVNINLNLEDLIFTEFISEIERRFLFLANKKDINIIFTLSPDLKKLKLRADVEKLNQIFSSLIGNSLRFTKRLGTITVDISVKEQQIGLYSDSIWINFKISDDGIGIPEQILPIIFKPYDQANLKIEELEGVGLGLFLTKRLIEQMKGSITVESTINVGTVFKFSLNMALIKINF